MSLPRSIARNVATVGAATLFSRVLGFVRDVLIASLFGAGIRADAFFVAFQLANLVRRLLAEGGLNAAFVPLYLRARDQSGTAAAAFAGKLLGTFTLGLACAAIALAVIMPAVILILAPGFDVAGQRLPLAVDMARLMLPYLVFAGPLAVLMGVLNANHRFAAAALATAAFNATILAVLAAIFFFAAGNSDFSARLLAAAVGLAGFSQIVLVAVAAALGRYRAWPVGVSFGADIRKFLALAIPGLLAGGIPQITVIAGVMVASTSRSAVSWIYYANRLIELPLGLVGIAIGTVLVPAFVHAIRRGDRQSLAAAESRGLELALGLALPAAVALFLLAEPIVRALFQRGAFTHTDTAATAAALAAFAFGLPGHVLVKTFSPAFFAREDTRTPMLAAIAGFVIAVGGSLALMPFFGHVGIAVAISLSGWASAGLLGALIARRIGFSLDGDAKRRLPRIGLAAAAMGLAIESARRAAEPWTASGVSAIQSIALLTALILIGLCVYALLLRILGVLRMRDIVQAARTPL